MKILHIPTGQICYWKFDTEQLFPWITNNLQYFSQFNYQFNINITKKQFNILIKEPGLRVFIDNIHNLVLYPNDPDHKNDTDKISFNEFTLIE